MPDNSQLQTTVVIASSLKPVKDIRAWGKLGNSLRETSKYRLNIIGFSPKKIEKSKETNFYSSSVSGRSPWNRFRAMVRFAYLLIQIRPKLLICCTYEYLPIARLLKKTIGYKLVYDVQENYVANLELNPLLGGKQRKQLTKIIEQMERPKGIDLFLLAESCYQNEMPEKTPFLILENKYAGEIRPTLPINYEQKVQFKFLISGTLSPAYGTLEGIVWYKKISRFYPESSLRIIGHVPLNFYKNEIQNPAEKDPSISIELSDFPLPHTVLLDAYDTVDFLLLPYLDHQAIRNKMPTKLFEASALGIPVLITPNPKWDEFLEVHNSGFSIDFSKTDSIERDFKRAISKSYFTKQLNDSLLWESQKQAFVDAMDSLISK